MLRKHLNNIKMYKYKNNTVPFYNWECLTVQLENRDVDLVIKDVKSLFDIMTLLVYYLNTVDGKRNSAQQFLENLSPDLIIDHDVRKQVVLGVMKKYKVMKLRFKLAYLAFEGK